MLLRINVWISFRGLQDSRRFKGVSFPYIGKCPTTRKDAEFGCILDVYDEIINIYEETIKEGFSNLGEALHTQISYFADYELLVDSKMQNRIKEFQFCKTFSCPPYPSLSQTPAEIIDDFMIIEEEYKSCIAKQQKEQKDA